MAPSRSIAAAVLVGGRSTRMGRDKALIEIDGVAMARRVAAAAAAAGCAPVVAVGPAHLSAGLDAVVDEHPGEGPLGAILTALHAMAPQRVLVVACDMPWVDVSTLQHLVGAAQAATPDPDADDDGVDAVMAVSPRREPLCAIWMPSCTAALQRAFDAGERAVHRAARGLRVVEVLVDAAAVFNVNAPQDLPE